jgi:hypothetical protein
VSNIFDPVYVVHVWGENFKFGKPFYGEVALSTANDFFEEQKARPDVTDADFLRKEGDRWVDVAPRSTGTPTIGIRSAERPQAG